MNICDTQQCFGCEVCRLSCPKHAIEMRSSKKGFLHPCIDDRLCVGCGACIDACPANNREPRATRPRRAYAGWSKNGKTRKQSSSGGIFTEIAQVVHRRGGVVFGARWGQDFSVVYGCAENADELNHLRGSKYTQAKLGDCFPEIKSLLDAGREVLFSGTPCLVDALRHYLGKYYKKLVTVDLVCHGVPSPRVFADYIDSLESRFGTNVREINLREKRPSWYASSTKVAFDNGLVVSCLNHDSPFFIGFNSNLFLRECCYVCKYANCQRVGDISLADFWGFAPRNIRMLFHENGCSAILVNTDHGEEMFSAIRPHIVTEERTIEEIVARNGQLRSPAKPQQKFVNSSTPVTLPKFWELYDTNGWDGVSAQLFPPRGIPITRIRLHILRNKLRVFIPEPVVRLSRALRR